MSHHNCKPKCCKKEVYDVIICGAGTAGSVLAKLASDKGLSVLVLDRGENVNNLPISKFPFRFFPEYRTVGLQQAIRNPLTIDTLINTVAMVPAGGNTEATTVVRPVILSQNDEIFQIYKFGNGWGGSSNHNYLMAIRPSPEFADQVGAVSDPLIWNQNTLLAKYIANENYRDGPSPYRGTTGPYQIIPLGNPPGPDTQYWILEAMKATSNSVSDRSLDGPFGNPDYNANYNRVFYPFNQNSQQFGPGIVGTVRISSSIAYLGPDVVEQDTGLGVNGRKLRIISNAPVTKVLFKQNEYGGAPTANAVEAVINGKTAKFYARHKVVVSAGAGRTPGILERSGVGRPDVLAKAGVPLVVSNANVGENLQNHCGPQMYYKVNQAYYKALRFGGTVKMFDDAVLNPRPGQSRRIQIFNFPGGGFGVGAPSLTTLECLGINSTAALRGRNADGTPFPMYTLWGVNLQPTSLGSCHIVSPNPNQAPELRTNTLTTQADVDAAREFYRWAKRTEDQLAISRPELGFQLVYPPPGTDYSNNTVIDRYIGSFMAFTDHVSSSCPMNADPAKGVVDARLHVHGAKNLMVADTSIWPFIPDCNTAISAVAVGQMAADFL